MNAINNPKLKFFNLGIWKYDGNINFYHSQIQICPQQIF